MALRTSKLSKNCASRGLVGPFRRAARAEKGPPGLQGGGGGAAAPAAPPLATCLQPCVRDLENGFVGAARAHVQRLHSTSRHVKSSYLMGPVWSHTKFERNRASRCGVTEGV